MNLTELRKHREDNRWICVQFCPDDNGSFCENHFQIDCMYSRLIGEVENTTSHAPTVHIYKDSRICNQCGVHIDEHDAVEGVRA